MEENINVGSTGKTSGKPPVLDNMSFKKIIDAPEVENIKHDLDSLNKNSRALVREGVDQIKSTGQSKLHDVEAFVREKPTQGIAFGVVAGMVLSWLLGLKRKN